MPPPDPASRSWARRDSEDWLLDIRVQPGARRTEVAGPHGGRLRIRLAAPANEGKANAELVRFVARRLGVNRSKVEIAHGQHSRDKTLRIDGLACPEQLLED